jgi:hypothetical protein
LALPAALVFAPQAPAHHSYTGYDRSRSRTVEGTVVKLDWANPHVHFWVAAADSGGAEPGVYAFEAGSVSLMRHFGWTDSTFRIGEKVTVTFFPLSDGRAGGAFIKARHQDGSWSTGDLAGVNYFSR